MSRWCRGAVGDGAIVGDLVIGVYAVAVGDGSAGAIGVAKSSGRLCDGVNGYYALAVGNGSAGAIVGAAATQQWAPLLASKLLSLSLSVLSYW